MVSWMSAAIAVVRFVLSVSSERGSGKGGKSSKMKITVVIRSDAWSHTYVLSH